MAQIALNTRKLILFVKNPVRGNVKTRLAASAGDEKALEIYRKLLDVTAGAALKTDAEKLVCYSQHIDREDWFDEAFFDKSLQSGKDLGMRMLNAFKKQFEEGYKEIVLIGSDCPDISPDILNQAFIALGKTDCVIGPSSDGGYYLIGLRRLIPRIFEQMTWSVNSVLEETIRRLNSLDVSYHLLPELNDIDTLEDLKQSGLNI